MNLEFSASWKDYGGIIADVYRHAEDFRYDLARVVPEVKAYVRAANRECRMAQVGADGSRLPDIKESTVQRRRRAGKGDGPAMVPDGDRSRAINNLVVDASQTPRGFRVTTQVVGAGFLEYHLTPTVHRPARDVLGLPGRYWDEVDRMVLDEILRQWGEWMARKARPTWRGRARGLFNRLFRRGK